MVILGLNINEAKSFAGLEMTITVLAASNLGLSSSELQIRYLGLPLTTKSMSRNDYEPLIDKIHFRMLSWSNKSIIFGLHAAHQVSYHKYIQLFVVSISVTPKVSK